MRQNPLQRVMVTKSGDSFNWCKERLMCIPPAVGYEHIEEQGNKVLDWLWYMYKVQGVQVAPALYL